MKKIIRGILKKDLGVLILITILTVAIGISQIAFNILFGKIADAIISGGDLNKIIKYLIMVSIITIVFIAIRDRIKTYKNNQMMHDVNYEVLTLLQKSDILYFSNKSTNNIIQTINIDSWEITNFICGKATNAINNTIVVAFISAYIFKLSPRLFVILFIGIASLSLMYFLLRQYLTKIHAEFRDRQSDYFRSMFSMLENIFSIKVNSLYDELGTLFNKANDNFLRVLDKNEKATIGINNISFFVIRIVILFICVQSVNLIGNGNISVGEFVSVAMLLNILMPSLNSLLGFNKEYRDVRVNYERMDKFCKVKKDINGTEYLTDIDNIKIQNLDFAYAKDEKLFDNLNYEFEKGNIYQIKGTNGTGKTTLTTIMLGLIQPGSGSILYENRDINTLDTLNIRRNIIAYVEQEPIIERMTIRENIELGLDGFSEKEYERLYELFDIGSFDNGEIVSQSMLSGGQKQKINIMKSLLKKSDVLFMDEPTSALDHQTREILKKELKTLAKDKIIIIISHDENFIDVCNKVLDLNKIKEMK